MVLFYIFFMFYGHSLIHSSTFVLHWKFAVCRSYKCGNVQCDCCEDSNWILEEKLACFTFVWHMMDIRFSLDILVYVLDLLLHQDPGVGANYCRIAAWPCYFKRDIVLVYIRFMSDGHSVDDGFTFISRWTFASCRSCMCGNVWTDWTLTVMRILIDFWSLVYIGFT